MEDTEQMEDVSSKLRDHECVFLSHTQTKGRVALCGQLLLFLGSSQEEQSSSTTIRDNKGQIGLMSGMV